MEFEVRNKNNNNNNISRRSSSNSSYTDMFNSIELTGNFLNVDSTTSPSLSPDYNNNISNFTTNIIDNDLDLSNGNCKRRKKKFLHNGKVVIIFFHILHRQVCLHLQIAQIVHLHH